LTKGATGGALRLFVAIYPPPEAASHLAAYVADLGVGRAAAQGVNARLAAGPTWHLTLVFLGDVPPGRLADVESTVGGAVRQWRAAGTAPMVKVAGGGTFGRSRFTILWAGLAGDVEPLRQLGAAARRALRRARLPYDEKPFKPHLTLARPGDRVDITADVTALRAYEGPQWSVDEVRLVRSHLGPKPSYDRLADW
jgi:2'-5' RNA ligase